MGAWLDLRMMRSKIRIVRLFFRVVWICPCIVDEITYGKRNELSAEASRDWSESMLSPDVEWACFCEVQNTTKLVEEDRG